MKIIQILLSLFLSTTTVKGLNSTFSPASLGGELAGNITLSPSQGSFTVEEDVVVPEGSTLTVMHGVNILFRPSTGIKVIGSLIAKGRPESKISFSSLTHPNTSLNASFYYGDGIRLVDGNAYNKGRVEILRNGQWGTICGRHWEWYPKNTDVACRQLGFLRAKRYFAAAFDQTKPYLMTSVKCKGSEVSLLQCQHNAWNYCYGSRYQVGIECEYLQSYLQEQEKWRGMSFEMTLNSSAASILRHVIIENASLALNITDKAPMMSNITVRNCIHGIQASEINGKFELTDSLITDNVLSGIRINKSHEDIMIRNSSFTRNTMAVGFSYGNHLVANDFCTWNQSWISKYPLVLNAASENYVQCHKIIQAKENSTLTLHYHNITGSSFWVNIFSKDGRGNWILISRVNENDAGKMHKVITSKTNALKVSFANSHGSKSSIELIIVDIKETKSMIISDTLFLNNGLHGVKIVDFIGLLQMNNTKVNQNKLDGMYINGLYGEFNQYNCDAMNNSQSGLRLERISGKVSIESVKMVHNKQDGAKTFKGTGTLFIKNGVVQGNARHGVYIGSQRNTYVHLSNLEISQSKKNGLFLENTLNGSVKLINIKATLNKKSGTYFLRCSTPVFIERSFAEENGGCGFYFQVQVSSVKFIKFSACRNQESGLRVDDGVSYLLLEHGILKENSKHGFYLNNHGKEILMHNISIINNKERAINVYENSQGNRITLFSVSKCYISGNKVGMNLMLSCAYKLDNARNVSIQLQSNTFVNNTLETFGFYHEYTCFYSSTPRQVFLNVVNNTFIQNKKSVIHISCPGIYALQGTLASNEFLENMGKVVTIKEGTNCGYRHKHPIRVQITSNRFEKNKGQYMVYIDLQPWYTIRSAVLRHNSFVMNKQTKLPSRFYSRKIEDAVIVLKEGTFEIVQNSFENPNFTYQVATALAAHERVFNASHNWWTTVDECLIKSQIFDFEDRLDLARVEYFPFLENKYNFKAVSLRSSRPFCFLKDTAKGTAIGGALDRHLELNTTTTPYIVTSDVIVLPSGSIGIISNVTLKFPARSAFLVKGSLQVYGKKDETVKFTLDKAVEDVIRLKNGWYGNVEIKFNNTWMTLCVDWYFKLKPNMICNHFNMEYESRSLYRRSGKEAGFIDNLKCDYNLALDMSSCNYKNLSYTQLCNGNVLYLRCKRPYWSGLHLAMTKSKSSLMYLEIHEGGYNYRSTDLTITSAALRVDFDNHVMRNIMVKNSSSVGVHVMYLNPFKNVPTLSNSLVEGSESNGMQISFSDAVFDQVKITASKGSGIYLRSFWNDLDLDARRMSDPTLIHHVSNCKEKSIFIQEGESRYLIFSPIGKTSSTCVQEIYTTKRSKIAVQIIYKNIKYLPSYYDDVQVNSGGKQWKLEDLSWGNRPVLYANDSSMHLRFMRYYAYSPMLVHLLAFSLTDTNGHMTQDEKISIKNCVIENTSGSGIYAYGPQTESIFIKNSTIQGSLKNGIEISSSTTRLVVQSSTISRHMTCVLLYSLNDDYYKGINGKVLISNSVISKCSKKGLYAWASGRKNVIIEGSLLSQITGNAVDLNGRFSETSLYIKKCKFMLNKLNCIMAYSGYDWKSRSSNEFIVADSNFSNNAGRVINIERATSLAKWLIERNVFFNNSEPTVISIGKVFSQASYSIKNNSFISNRCNKDAVIDLRYSASFVTIDKNIFLGNFGPAVVLKKAATSLHLDIKENTFKNNLCLGCPILKFLRVEKDLVLENNIFSNNSGRQVIFLQAVFKISANTFVQKLSLTNNVFDNNHPIASASSNHKRCVVDVRGILVYKEVQWRRNKMSNSQFDYELCLHTLGLCQQTLLIANETWWEAKTENDISRKVFSFDDNYEYGIVQYGSFLALENNALKTKVYDADSAFNELIGQSILRGRIHKSITLQRHQSPFKVLEDVTVLPNTVLTIEPGVTVQLAPYTSILVLGTLIARGEKENHITFKHFENSKNSEALPSDIRLMDGKFPWYGRLEVYHHSSWKPLCTERWTMQNTIVACRQLGYGGPSESDIRLGYTEINRTYSFELQCSGNESSIAKCLKKSTRENLDRRCQSVVGLRCRGKEWGSIRFSRPAIDKSIVNKSSSVLEYVDIMYAGKRESSNTSAIEIIRKVPIIKHLKVLNCSSGGMVIVLPDKNPNVEDSQFMNTGGTGITVMENTKSIVIQDSFISENDNGVVFTRWDDRLISSFHVGQDGVFLCDNKIQTIDVKENEFLYFVTTPVKGYTNDYPTVQCQKRVRTEKGMGVVLRVLSVKGSQTLRVRAGNTDVIKRDASFWKSLNIYIDFEDVQVIWQGTFSTNIVLLASAIPLKEMPCTFIRYHMCGWQSIQNKRVLGMTTNYLFRYLYFSNSGPVVGTQSQFRNEYVNLVSPFITPSATLCRLDFEYDLNGRSQDVWLAVMLEESVNGKQIHTKIWSSDEDDILKGKWMWASIKIPLSNKPFRIVLFGHLRYAWHRYIYLRNLKFENCSAVSETIDVNGNVFTKNRNHSILLNSDTVIQQFNIKIHRNKLTDAVDDVSTGAIRINTYNNPFVILNNFISNNNNGGVYATVGNRHGNLLIRSTIERNYFQGNKKQTIYINTGESGKAFNIYIFGNTLNGNNGKGTDKALYSNIKLSQVVCYLKENFVYNNYGRYNLEIMLNKKVMPNRLIIVRNNTFYYNHGLIKDYGSTMYCNGPLEVYKNIIKNPSNLYELVTDRASLFRTMNATDNWWGFGLPKIVGARILDLFDDAQFPRVNYHPYVRLRPPTAVPLSCPTGWSLYEESCFLYNGGPLSFHEAGEHCLMYGSHLLSSSQELDMSFIKTTFSNYDNRSGGINMRVWITNAMEVSGCAVYTQNNSFIRTPCQSLQPFVCSKTPVIRCPNNCFHNGNCVGTTCFCNKGWTGPDCSKFHCNNLRNCSGHGTCVGPNVCRCLQGISGRACTYSYCSQFENCRSCMSNKNCGWCDELAQCLPGYGEGSFFGTCQSWFFYNCYTMGRPNFCSREISLIDCSWQLCNLEDFPELASKEACQRCKDQEMCFKAKVGETCRTWNETRCPTGQVKIDYSDPTRIQNTQIKENVRVINPEKVTMYRCAVNEASGDVATVFVFSANLTLKSGDVISSNQAGGVFHKVSVVNQFEPYTFVTADPASIGDFIQYADFQIDASLGSLEDEVTVEAESDMEMINNLMYGNTSLNETLFIVPSDTFVYKCVGHMYEAGESKAASYYLVLNASNTPFKIETGDVIVSNQSNGFLSTITRINKTSEFTFVETLLLRCDNNTEMNLKFHSELNDEDLSCPGGDNNPSLLIKENNDATVNMSVNDVIAGRASQPFAGKVKSFYYSNGFIIVEVFPVTTVFNGTAMTEIEITKPLSRVRRKRAIRLFSKRITLADKKRNFDFLKHGENRIGFFLNFRAGLTIGMQLEVSSIGLNKLKTPSVRMALFLTTDAAVTVGVRLKTHLGLSFSKGKSLIPPKALARFVICIFFFCIPSGIFFNLDATAYVKAEFTTQIAVSYTLGISNVGVTGSCSTRGQCTSSLTKPEKTRKWNFDFDMDSKLSAGFTLTPRLTLQIPAVPKLLRLPKKIKRAPKLMRKIVKKKTGLGSGTPLAVKLSLEIPIIVEASTSLCSRHCHPKKGLVIKAGARKIKVAISFGDKELLSKSFGCLPMFIKEICYNASLLNEFCDWKFNKRPHERPDNECGNDNKTNQRRGKCGDFPVCLPGWSGEGCSKPDPPSGCVNGKIHGSGNCTVTCKCFPGWIGTSCNVRAPSVIIGDPHLSTFDGVHYDYFGIGEHWGCQSIENDFGLQFRFFAYDRSSLTGGIALKAGNNTITLMTVRTPINTDFPVLRVNGQKQDVNSLLSKEVKLDNGSVSMRLYRNSTGNEKESAVMLMSFEYKSGIAVSVDVRHSKVMGRQYINTGLTPTIDLMKKTHGLYGYMDGDPSNDLQGPNGKRYSDPIKFAESWRIKTSSPEEVLWSWKDSNFHPDDVMDYSYTDPSFLPIYNLQGVDEHTKREAIRVCSTMELTGDLLKGCVYDIAITNDTTLSEQESLQQGCENSCSGRGRCVNKTCECIEGWSGKACEIGRCSNCSLLHGKCLNGFCYCSTGWEGENCDQEATCLNLNNCTSPLHGKCKTTNVCQCNDGFTGKECNIVPTCHGVGNCSLNGVCVNFDFCKCNKDWTGQNCSEYSCHDLSFCSGHGRCVNLYECKCDRGWTGVSCGVPDCPDVNQCSQNGDCISSNKCKCKPGFQGEDCSKPSDCSSLSNCTNHGICENTDGKNSTCRCFSGFSGPTCNGSSCEEINNCTSHGECIDANLCNCTIGYSGYDCSNFSCEVLNFCSGRGECIDYDVCKCSGLWYGAACTIPNCTAYKDCSQKGDCIAPNTCECYRGYDGKYCDQLAPQNLHTPTFNTSNYNFTIKENMPAGTLLGMVIANDSDSGRNGKILYSLVPNRHSRAFALNVLSGALSTAIVFDYENQKDPLVNVEIVASDDGFPQKFSKVNVFLAIEDTNDNCPVFNDYPSDIDFTLLYVEASNFVLFTIHGMDADSGENGFVTHSIIPSNMRNYFDIDPINGTITARKILRPNVYNFEVIATDNGDPPCASSKVVKLSVITTQEPTSKPSTADVKSSSTLSKTSGTRNISTQNTNQPGTHKSTEDETTTGIPASSIPTDIARVPEDQMLNTAKAIGFTLLGLAIISCILGIVLRKIYLRNLRVGQLKSQPSRDGEDIAMHSIYGMENPKHI